MPSLTTVSLSDFICRQIPEVKLPYRKVSYGSPGTGVRLGHSGSWNLRLPQSIWDDSKAIIDYFFTSRTTSTLYDFEHNLDSSWGTDLETSPEYTRYYQAFEVIDPRLPPPTVQTGAALAGVPSLGPSDL